MDVYLLVRTEFSGQMPDPRYSVAVPIPVECDGNNRGGVTSYDLWGMRVVYEVLRGVC